jgi:hypothetical protein
LGSKNRVKINIMNKLSDTVSLRKLTFKSIIGFGSYKDLTVQDLCNLQRHKELLSIYYKLGRIDFVDEVKEYLCITGKRLIPKPGKDYTAYKFFHGEILYDIIEKERANGASKNLLYGIKKSNDKAIRGAQKARINKQNSPMINRARVQKVKE